MSRQKLKIRVHPALFFKFQLLVNNAVNIVQFCLKLSKTFPHSLIFGGLASDIVVDSSQFNGLLLKMDCREIPLLSGHLPGKIREDSSCFIFYRTDVKKGWLPKWRGEVNIIVKCLVCYVWTCRVYCFFYLAAHGQAILSQQVEDAGVPSIRIY